MEMRVNLLNEMKKYRSGYFTATTAILDEIVQNAQRSGAQDLSIVLKNGRLIVKDNGCGCDNLEALITKSQSGWDADTVKKQNAAGEGMYSVSMIADTLIFVSKVSCRFEFNKVFEENSMDCVVPLKTVKEHAMLIIKDFIVDPEVLFEEWIEYAHTHFQFVPVEIHFRSEDNEALAGNRSAAYLIELQHKNKYNTMLSDDKFDTYLDYSAGEKRNKLFYQGRYVTDFASTQVGMTIVVKDLDALGVRLPDRKDFVRDDRAETMWQNTRKLAVEYTAKTLPVEEWNYDVDLFCRNSYICNETMIEIFADLKLIKYHNEKKYVSFNDIMNMIDAGTLLNPITAYDLFSCDPINPEVIENNVYMKIPTFGLPSTIRSMLRDADVRINRPQFSGYKSKFTLGKDLSNGFLNTEFAKLKKIIARTMCCKFNVEDIKFMVCSVDFPEGADHFSGLCIHSMRKIVLNADHITYAPEDMKIKSYKHAKEFIIRNFNTIAHELSHALWMYEDRTYEHVHGMTEIYDEVLTKYILE